MKTVTWITLVHTLYLIVTLGFGIDALPLKSIYLKNLMQIWKVPANDLFPNAFLSVWGAKLKKYFRKTSWLMIFHSTFTFWVDTNPHTNIRTNPWIHYQVFMLPIFPERQNSRIFPGFHSKVSGIFSLF